MHHYKKVKELTVIDAVDHLTHMAEMDLISLGGACAEKQDLSPAEVALCNRELLKEAFVVLLHYLKQIYKKEKGDLKHGDMRKGIQAIMLLTAEAAQKMDHYVQDVIGNRKEESLLQLKEFQELQDFYQNQIVQKFRSYIHLKEGWQNEWSGIAEGQLLDIQRQGLKNLDIVRQDREYELFMMRQGDGKPFFNCDLLRHLHLVGEFDSSFIQMSDHHPFMQIKSIQDRDVHTTAKEILSYVAPYVDDYFKEAFRYKNRPFVVALNQAIMALMLASNPRHLIQQTSTKSCLSYFADFHAYLREALTSEEYGKYLYSKNTGGYSDSFFKALMHICYGLNTAFFIRVENKKEMIGFIESLITEGAAGVKVETEVKSCVSIWNEIADKDAQIRYVLHQYPNGPLMKANDLFKKHQSLSGYDPFAQENIPLQLYSIISEQIHVTCLKIPSPVIQSSINHVSIINEFKGFLHSMYREKNPQRHLLINLQDRTSWQDHARCLALEAFQKQEEYAQVLIVATIPKDGDFYEQRGVYEHLDSAQLFIQALKEQLLASAKGGYVLPFQIRDAQEFIDQMIPTIHRLFFSSKELLLRKNRLDFIEIVHLFLSLKLIDIYHPDTMSFTCKDAIDTGAASSTELYSFLKIMNGIQSWTQEEKQQILWMLYSSSFKLRNRAIDQERLDRMLSVLTLINGALEVNQVQIICECSRWYEGSYFKGVRVSVEA